MRRGEIQRLRWSDIPNLEGGAKVVLLETTKSGNPRIVICTKAMLEVLERQMARRVDGDDRRPAVIRGRGLTLPAFPPGLEHQHTPHSGIGPGIPLE